MKLCRDCKHSVWPNPLANCIGHPGPFYRIPMCGHPDARRSLVNGDLQVECVIARSDAEIFAFNDPRRCDMICGSDGKLFKERAPAPLPEPIRIVTKNDLGEMLQKRRKGWIARILGGD